MNFLTHIDTIDLGDEQKENLSGEQKAKLVMNSLLKVVPTFDAEAWVDIFGWMGVVETPGNTASASVFKQVYKNATITIVTQLAKKHKWQFANDANLIYIYDEKFWIEVEVKNIKHFLNMIANKLGVPRWIASDAGFIDNLYKQLEPEGFFEPMVHPNATLLNFTNGTLHIDLKTVQLKPFNRLDFMTHQLDYQYDKSAVNNQWLGFLDMVLPDKDTQKTLQQSLGYLFTKDLKLEKATFLYGTGSNGKSVVFEVLTGLLDSKMITNYSLNSLTHVTGYHRSGLNNKLINYGTDISMKHMDHGVFKQLVSGEPVEVRQIYEKPYIMKNYAKLIFNLNKIDDADVESTIGFFRRMVFIPFEITIKSEDQDKNIHKKILQNKSGVLNWLVEGIEEVLKNQEIFISKRCEDFLENFKKESNLAIRFIEEVDLRQSTEETMSFKSLYESFIYFCKEQGEKPLSQKHFNAELKKIDYEFERKTHGNVWYAYKHSITSSSTDDWAQAFKVS